MGSWGWDTHDGIGVFLEEEDEGSLPHVQAQKKVLWAHGEHTVKKQPSTSQEVGSYEEPNLLAH